MAGNLPPGVTDADVDRAIQGDEPEEHDEIGEVESRLDALNQLDQLTDAQATEIATLEKLLEQLRALQ